MLSPQMQGLLAALAYGTVSVTITLFNKAVFAYYKFNFPLTLFVVQMLISIAMLLTLSLCKQVELPPRPWLKLVRTFLPLAAAWWVYGLSGVIAMRHLNVPMFSAFRRISALIVMCGEYFLFNKLQPAANRAAVCLMCLAAFAAAMTDTTLTVPGVFWVMVCAISTAGYLLLMKTLQNDQQNKMGDAAMLMVNNCCALPFMLVSWGVSGEVQSLPSFKQIHDAKFWMFLVLTASQACLLNYCIFLCNRKNSPITTSITGTVKDLVTNSFGLFIFGDVAFNVYNLSSIALCFAAACWCAVPSPPAAVKLQRLC